MRTAEEWYLTINSYANPYMMNDADKEWLKQQIILIQKEAIEECAKIAKADRIVTARDPRVITGCSVDKQSILSLINELK